MMGKFFTVSTNAVTGEVTVIPFSDEECEKIEAESIARSWRVLRAERNRLLAECDWTQTLDSPVDKDAWASYRQSLRDLPQNTTDPLNPIWPERPA